MRAFLLASGPVADYAGLATLIRPTDLLLVADGGIRHALALGLTPAQVFGDFDSVAAADLARANDLGWPLVRLPREKDETDTEAALAHALGLGATELVLVGALGGRLDHTLANLMLLPALAERGVRASIVDGRTVAFALRGPDELTLCGEAGDYLSLVPVTPTVTGVTLRGVKFPLTDATLVQGSTFSVSNEFAAPDARVTVGAGTALVIRSRD